MTGYLWAVLGIVAAVVMTAFRGMASDELRDRLDHLPHAILRLAARRLTPAQRTTIYQDEWVPELTYILRGTEARPITRLFTGTRYALGILVSAPRIARHLHRELEKAPSDSLRLPVGRPSSERFAWLLTHAEETRLREAGRIGNYPYVEEGTGRRWIHNEEKLDRMYAEGRIEFRKSGRPVVKRYLDEYRGAPLQGA